MSKKCTMLARLRDEIDGPKKSMLDIMQAEIK